MFTVVGLLFITSATTIVGIVLATLGVVPLWVPAVSFILFLILTLRFFFHFPEAKIKDSE